MKLNFGRRLVLFVHWLLSLAIIALGVVLTIWPQYQATVAALLNRTDVLIYGIAILAVYLLFAVGTVGIIFGGRKKRGEDHGFIVVDSSENGRTRIAVGAVEQMIRQAVRGVPGIADLRAGIVNNEDSIAINVDVAILNGAHVPTVTANIQRAIRGYIEHNCGVSVRGVSVSVHSLADAEQQSGRRGRKKKTEVGNYANATSVGNSYGGYGDSSAEPAAPAVPVFEAPAAEPEPAAELPEESEPIQLTLDPTPEPEASEPEAAAEAEPAPAEPEAAPAQKKGFFGKLFGKKAGSAPEQPAPVEEETSVGMEPDSEEVAAPEPAEDASETPDADGEA